VLNDKALTADSHSLAEQKALIGYQVAITLWTYQGEQWWARFNVMVAANSIVIGAATLAITSASDLQNLGCLFSVLLIGLPIAGLVLCGVWCLLTEREIAYSHYYVRSAREIEERYLSPPLKTVSRGAEFAEGRKVTIELGGESERHRMGWMARRLRAKDAARLVIAVFALLHVVLLLSSAYTVL
jgi:hypothetical protein